MPKILVTGGAGFIGSHLCEKLLNGQNEVICLDNFSTGDLGNVKHLKNNDRFTLLDQNVMDPIEVKVDQIYNLACAASPVHYQKDPLFTLKTNVLGMISVMECAIKSGASILQASTSEVYGDPEVHPQSEKYWGNVNPIGPRACYDEGKRCAETLVFDYERMYGVDVKVVRIFNTYGPRMQINDGRVVSNFIIQAFDDADITIYGDGSQTRSFCFVDDLVYGLELMMSSSEDVKGPINLGNPIEKTINDIASTIIGLTKSGSQVSYLPLPIDDPKRRRPDISLAKDKLGWEPQISLVDGLKKTIKYFSEAR